MFLSCFWLLILLIEYCQLSTRLYTKQKLSNNSIHDKIKEIKVGNFLNLMTIGKVTINIFGILFLIILHKYLAGKSDCSSGFFILKAIFETSFQINPFLRNSAFR